MDISAIKAVSDETDGGRWVDDLPGLPEVRLKVLPMDHPRVKAAYGRLARRHLRESPGDVEDGEAPDDVAEAIEAEVRASVILVGWDGLTNGGEPFDFTPERAVEAMDITLIYSAVEIAARRAQAQQDKALRGLAGNSPAPSREPAAA
jgi:hypothetical protein